MIDKNGLVSIIVVSYNHEAYIKECLDSVCDQTYKNWELIIADDASIDRSKDLIKEWLHSNNLSAKLVFHSTNEGLSKTLNECITLANGHYVKLFAADDMMHPQLIESSIQRFNEGSTELGLVYSNAYIINGNSEIDVNKTLLAKDNIAPSGWILDNLVEKNFIPALSVLLKKEVFDFVGPYRTDIVTEDYDIWIRAARKFQFAYINEVLSYYRVHDTNISTNYDFAADVVRLLIKNDIAGDFAPRIKKLIMDRYFTNTMKLEIANNYMTYKYKDMWLAFCLQNKMPYKIFRIIDKMHS